MVGSQAPAARPGYLAFLPSFLFDPGQRAAPYIAKAWLLSLIPTALLSVIVQLIFPQAPPPDLRMDGPLPIFLIVIAAPLLETLIMIVPLLVLNRLLGPGPAVVVSAILWGLAHSTAAPTWGLVVWWAFLVLSAAFLTWRERGLGPAILVVATIHALHNSAGVLAFLLFG